MELKDLTEQLQAVKGDIKKMVDDGNQTALKAAKDMETSLESKIKAATDAANEIKVKFDEVDKQLKEAEAASKRTRMEQEQKKQSFDQVLKNSLEPYTDELAKIAKKDNGRNQHLVIELKAVADVSTSNVTGSVWGQINRGGIVLNPDRKVHMRDLLPGGNLGPGSTYTFMRENGVGEGSPAFVAEGAAKPQFDMDLIESNVNIETMAGYIRVTRKAMMNVPGFVAYLQTKMPQRLLKAEDAGILYGSGTTPEIKGLLTSGNFVASTSTATVLAEKIIDDLSALEDTYERDATGIAMRPIHYHSFFKNKATGSGEYDLPDNVTFVNGRLYIGGVPVVKTTALNINLADTPDTADYIVGDFDNGAQFLTQEGMRIEFFEQDANNVTTNKVTVRIEETVALPVFGPNFFIKGSFAI